MIMTILTTMTIYISGYINLLFVGPRTHIDGHQPCQWTGVDFCICINLQRRICCSGESEAGLVCLFLRLERGRGSCHEVIVEALEDLFILLTKLTFEMHDGDTDGEEDDDLHFSCRRLRRTRCTGVRETPPDKTGNRSSRQSPSSPLSSQRSLLWQWSVSTESLIHYLWKLKTWSFWPKKLSHNRCRQDFFDIAAKPGRGQVVLDEVP